MQTTKPQSPNIIQYQSSYQKQPQSLISSSIQSAEQLKQISSLIKFPSITLKSIQIHKPQLDTSQYKKLYISIIMNNLNNQQRNLVRYISSKFAMNLYDDWDTYWNDKKIGLSSKKANNNLTNSSNNSNTYSKLSNTMNNNTSTINKPFGYQGQLIIIDEQSLTKILREIKINPTLRVILLIKNFQSFVLKDQHSFVMVTNSCKEVHQYLVGNKKHFIMTAKG